MKGKGWSEEERQLFKDLIGMSNDLHQLVRIAQKEGIQSAVLHFSPYRDRIDEVLKQYTIAKNLILTGHVKSLRDIFEIIPKSTVGRDQGMNYIRFSRLINHVEQFSLTDIIRMAALLEISNPEMVKIICNQYEADQKQKPK